MKTKILIVTMIMLTGLTAADSPDNITVELEFNPDSSVYVDGTEVDTDTSQTFFSLNYPYIVSEQPAGIVGLSGVQKIKYTNSTASSPEKFTVTQTGNEFLLPFTQGGQQTVEAEEDEILNGNFLDGLEPSFSFFEPEIPYVKVSYLFQHSIEEYTGSKDGIDTVTIRNMLNGKNKTELSIQAE